MNAELRFAVKMFFTYLIPYGYSVPQEHQPQPGTQNFFVDEKYPGTEQ
jgi:hypothetical protein